MPYKPQSACYEQGCPKRREVGSQYCKEHMRKYRKRYDGERGTATERGYDHKWQKFRMWFLKRNPMCEICKKKGIVSIATVVHHIIPLEGKNDVRKYDVGNCQALCVKCHNIVHKRFKK